MSTKFVFWHFAIFPFFLGFIPVLLDHLYGNECFYLSWAGLALVWLFGPGMRLRTKAAEKNPWPVILGVVLAICLGMVVGVMIGARLGGVVVYGG